MHLPRRPLARALVLLAALPALLGALAANAAWPPSAVELRFDLHAAGVKVGETVWRIQHPDESTIAVENVTEPVAPYSWLRPDVVRESSTLRLEADGLRTLRYRHSRTGGKRDRFVTVDVDLAAGVARGESKGTKSEVAAGAGTVDKLGYLLALARDSAQGITTFDYPVATGAEVERYRLEVRGREQLDTALGPLDAIRIERLGQERRQTVLWLAPAFDHLPVRIEHTEKDGASVTLTLTDRHPS